MTTRKIVLFRYIFLLAHLVVLPFFTVILYLVMRVRVIRYVPINITKRGFLVVSNHQSWYDPFVVTLAWALSGGSWRHFFISIPMWYPTLSGVIRNPVAGSLIRPFGAFDIGLTPLERARGLMFTRHLLRSGENILLFPEAKCIRTGNDVAPFHPGITTLYAEAVPIILVRLVNMNAWKWFNVWNRHQVDFHFELLPVEMPADERRLKLEAFYAPIRIS